ncbi:MAG TPA: ATP-binding protein [Terriglobia bacterium]|jgi:heavy metal sensor kinase
MRPLALRTKLTLFYSITVSVLLTGFAFIYYNVLNVGLNRDLTTEVVDRAEGLHSYLLFEEGKPVFTFDPDDPDEVTFVRTATRYYQVYDTKTGVLLDQSDEFRATAVVFSASDVAQYAKNKTSFLDVQTDEGKLRLRNEVVQVNGNSYLLVVGASMQTVEDTVSSFIKALAWLIPTGVLLAAIASWFMARKALEPVAALGRAAGEIGVSQLHQRLPVRGTGDELDYLAIQFNGTFARLEKAVEEMKQFTASISHEFRTPLAVLRGEAEIALMESSTAGQYRRVLASQLEEFEKLTRMINQLLTLARAESGEVAIVHEPVDLSTMTQSLAEQLEPVAASKNVNLSWNCDPGVIISGDAGWIERIVLNLIDNAIKFTASGGHVAVSVSQNEKHRTLEVKDDGAGIPADSVPRIFERFYRADPSRANRADGVGLGLSLVKWAVDQHQGAIDVETNPGRGSTFRVTFPA